MTTAEACHAVDTAEEADAAPKTFNALGLGEHITKVCHSLGMTVPTPVQGCVIPAVMAGRDCVAVAETGSGKTAAFALPILHSLAQERYGVHSLILTPTRELAFQIAEQFAALGAGLGLRHTTVVGGLDQHEQTRALTRKPHVVTATPGRLAEELATSPDLAAGFRRCARLVLDEADRILEPTFGDALKVILAVLPKTRQTLLFTATWTGPIDTLSSAVLQQPFVFRPFQGLRTVGGLREHYLLLPAKVKEVYLVHVLNSLTDLKVRNAIIFCSRRRGCELVGGTLHRLGFQVVSLHGGRPQKARLAALQQFKAGQVRLLVATDVASRGLDIPTVDLVVNVDIPAAPSDYVHRVGRTARSGRRGWALTLLTQYDVQRLQQVEDSIGHQLEAYELDEDVVLQDITRVFAARRATVLAMENAKVEK